jgi:hypothetical protein
MMIIAVAGWVILATNIDNGVTCGQLSWISGTNERRGGIGRELAKKIDGQSLVGVEMTAEWIISLWENTIIEGASVNTYEFRSKEGGSSVSSQRFHRPF